MKGLQARAGGRGDYGFGWNPHGDYARERRGDEFGTLEEGELVDVLVIDGDPLADIAVLEDRSRFIAVMQAASSKLASSRSRSRPS